MYIHTYVRTYVCMYVCMYVCQYVYSYTLCILIICSFVYTYVCTCIFMSRGMLVDNSMPYIYVRELRFIISHQILLCNSLNHATYIAYVAIPGCMHSTYVRICISQAP